MQSGSQTCASDSLREPELASAGRGYFGTANGSASGIGMGAAAGAGTAKGSALAAGGVCTRRALALP